MNYKQTLKPLKRTKKEPKKLVEDANKLQELGKRPKHVLINEIEDLQVDLTKSQKKVEDLRLVNKVLNKTLQKKYQQEEQATAKIEPIPMRKKGFFKKLKFWKRD